MDIKDKVIETIKEIENTDSLQNLDIIKANSIGKSGFITKAFSGMKNLSGEEKKNLGLELNSYKEEISNKIEEIKAKLEDMALQERLNKEYIDVTLPCKPLNQGSIHPISRARQEFIAILTTLGFKFVDGYEMESDFYNFTALNIPELHPARDMHDTFYLAPDRLLRTHTSSVQIRYMQKHKVPCKIFSIGRTYRCDSDMTHSPMFHQMEGLYIDKSINMGHLKYVLKEFITKFFEKEDIPMRLRPSYFPFTEPSSELDIRCDRSNGNIKIGEGDSWLEVLGCGMVHPNVLKNCGIDPDIYQGFAFGMGVERMAMLKYGISDLRTFFEGDKRWLNKYNTPYYDIPSLGGGLS